MDASTLQAWWAHRQGLDGSLAGAAPADVLARSGWARSVAGVGPYLTLFSRAAIGRKAADAAVAALQIHELPSARGCTYVVPAGDFALALRCVAGFGWHADRRSAEKLGVTDEEIAKLCDAILAALTNGPLDPEAIRDAVGGAARKLGDAGKKKGLTTTLPLALGKLQEEGEIRRVPVNGRLDQQRYRYTLWRPNPLATFRLSQDEVHAELARRYFRWTGPAALADFQWFSGLGVKAVKAATAVLGLVAIPGDENRLLFPEDLDALQGFQPPHSPQPVLVSSLDALVLLRRDLASLVAEEDRKTKVLADKGVASLGGLSDLPSHAIVDRGRVIGLWEYDPDSGTIAWMTFGRPAQPAAAAIAEAVAKVEAFVRDDLGDARSFSLDSPTSRAPRIAAIRKAAKVR